MHLTDFLYPQCCMHAYACVLHNANIGTIRLLSSLSQPLLTVAAMTGVPTHITPNTAHNTREIFNLSKMPHFNFIIYFRITAAFRSSRTPFLYPRLLCHCNHMCCWHQSTPHHRLYDLYIIVLCHLPILLFENF